VTSDADAVLAEAFAITGGAVTEVKAEIVADQATQAHEHVLRFDWADVAASTAEVYADLVGETSAA
jgi:hypothetical protein